MNAWFLNTSLYKNHLESYVKKRAMTIKTKLTLSTSLTMAMAIGFFAMHRIPVGQIILVIVWLIHILFFFFGIKTLKVETTVDTPPQVD